MINKTIAVIGGDERAIYAARFLADRGAKITLYGLEEHFMGNCAEFKEKECKAPYLVSEAVETADILLLPLPFSKDNRTVFTPFSKEVLTVSYLQQSLENSQRRLLLVGGGLSKYNFFGHTVLDLLEDDVFISSNALPTAEGALGLAILHHRSVLFSCPVAVLGFGRIASVLAKKLSLLGADVTVFARRAEQLAEAKRMSLKTGKLSDFSKYVGQFSIFFNTIPMEIISSETAEKMRRDSLYIELASPPYGMTDEAKKCYRGDHLPAPGLPGRYCPEYAGKIIADVLEQWTVKSDCCPVII